jgi:murein L,D-transpeptidase YafK
MLLGRKGMDQSSPIFVRIFKEESELEVWKARDDGRFYHFKTYPICNWSGDLGPKKEMGDRQAPEGFYKVSTTQLNPNSQYYLAFNIGYPNAYDRSLKRTGSSLMVHGKCKSAGCYAMTDALIEEIYGLARESLKGGQDGFQVHAFPFRMTDANMARYHDNPNYKFWKTLKQGYDFFEKYRLPPQIAVCEHRYLVNVKLAGSGSFNPNGVCPRFTRPVYEPFVPKPGEQQVAQERITVPGPKMREVASATPPQPAPASRPDAQPDFATSFGLGGLIETGSTALGLSQ